MFRIVAHRNINPSKDVMSLDMHEAVSKNYLEKYDKKIIFSQVMEIPGAINFGKTPGDVL